MPRVPTAWISASSLPCVTQISGAPTSSTVRFSSSQSAWSEMTSGSSTPRARARCRTRIQPRGDAPTTGSASRRAQRSAIADGGASTMAPASSAFFATVAARRSPSSTPSSRIGEAERHVRAVQIDRPVPAGLAQQRDHALAFAERVAAHDMRAPGEQRHAVEQPGDLVLGLADGGTPAARTSPRSRTRRRGSARTARRSGPGSACSRRSPPPGCRGIRARPARCRARGRRDAA